MKKKKVLIIFVFFVVPLFTKKIEIPSLSIQNKNKIVNLFLLSSYSLTIKICIFLT